MGNGKPEKIFEQLKRKSTAKDNNPVKKARVQRRDAGGVEGQSPCRLRRGETLLNEKNEIACVEHTNEKFPQGGAQKKI